MFLRPRKKRRTLPPGKKVGPWTGRPVTTRSLGRSSPSCARDVTPDGGRHRSYVFNSVTRRSDVFKGTPKERRRSTGSTHELLESTERDETLCVQMKVYPVNRTHE